MFREIARRAKLGSVASYLGGALVLGTILVAGAIGEYSTGIVKFIDNYYDHPFSSSASVTPSSAGCGDLEKSVSDSNRGDSTNENRAQGSFIYSPVTNLDFSQNNGDYTLVGSIDDGGFWTGTYEAGIFKPNAEDGRPGTVDYFYVRKLQANFSPAAEVAKSD